MHDGRIIGPAKECDHPPPLKDQGAGHTFLRVRTGHGIQYLNEFVDQIKLVIDPQQFLLAEVDGQAAGFCFGFPDWAPLFRSFNGTVGPLQILRLLLRAKRYDRAGLLAIGVRDTYRGRHIGQTLAATLYRRYEELGLHGALYYPVNDHNLASRRLAESFGATGRILYTAYDKPLI